MKMWAKSALVLKEKTINENGPLYIRLVGRKSGFTNWILTLLGINPTTILEVYENRIEYTSGSLSGYTTDIIPLKSISNATNGYFKPIGILVLAVVAFVICFILSQRAPGLQWFGLAVAIVCVIKYIFSKTMLLAITPHSAVTQGMSFKRSFIENKGVSAEEAQKICRIIANSTAQSK